MRIALAQIQVEAGKPQENVDRLLHFIENASQSHADMVCAPEMCIGGYLLGDLWLDDDYCRDLMHYNNQIAQAARKHSIAVSFGNIYLEDDINKRLGIEGYHPNHDGRLRRYNAVYVFDKNGEPAKRAFDQDSMMPKGVEIKTNLPNYRIFDDERYFFSKLDHCLDFGINLESSYVPFEINGEHIGMALCEDLWCEDYRLHENSINPTLWLIKNNASIVVNASASPWTYGKNKARDKRVEYVYSEIKNQVSMSDSLTKPSFLISKPKLLYVNCIGVQNNGKNLVIFDGGSTVYNENGQPCIYDNQYNPCLMSVETDYLPKPTPRIVGSKIQQKYSGIIWAIKQFLGGTKVINGVSGGIDSAVTTALYVKALGKDKVIGVNMPSKYNKDITKSAAKKLCNNLGIRYHVVPIEELAETTRSTLIKYQYDSRSCFSDIDTDCQIPQLVDENLQAKIRAISILSNIAQIEGGVYSCNGNKVELAIGYFTLDADGRGALNPIGDLTKEEVYDLGHYLNKEIFKSEIIPNEILDPEIIIPSAELASGQYDPIKVGYHCRILDKMTNYKISSATTFMELWLSGKLHEYLDIPLSLMERYSMTDGEKFVADLKWFLSRERNQVFKRVQSVPIILLSKTSYGYDRRESIMPPYSFTSRAAQLANLIISQKTYPIV